MHATLFWKGMDSCKIYNGKVCQTCFFPHIFVWGSCFCFCIPLLVRLPLSRLNTIVHTSLSHTSLSHTIFHTQLCHTSLCHPQLCHTPSFTHNFVTHTTLLHTIFHTQLCHTPLCHTHNFVTPLFVTHNFVTHHLSHTTLSHTTLLHTIFHTQLCHTPLCHTPSFTQSFVTPLFVTHNFVTHHLSHTTLSHTTLLHTIFHTQLCHTPLCHTHNFVTPLFVTHNFVTHHLSHTTLSHTTLLHTIFHTQLCHTPLCHTPSFTQSFVTPLFVTHNFVTHHLSHTTLSQTTSLHTTFHAQLCYTCLFVTHLFGTFRHPTLFAWPLVALGWPWWRAWVPLVAVTPRHFAWQAWRLATSTFVSRGRRGTWRHSPSFCVAGTALSLRGRPGPDCTGLDLVARLGAVSRPWRRGTLRGAWHLVTSTFVSRGRRGTWRHSPSFCVAGTALSLRGRPGPDCTGLDLVAGLGAVSRPWRRGTLRGAWHLVTSTFVLRGKRGTVRHPHSLCVAGVALMALGWLSWRGRRAGVALGDIHLRFAWQAWHLAVLRGRRGAYGTGLALLAWRAWHSATSTLALRQVKLCGSRGTCSHRPTFCMFYFCACLIETLWKRCLHMLQPTACRPCLAMSYLHTVFGCICYFVTWLSISGLVALAQCGKRPCACLIDTLWKRCWPVSACLIET